MLTRIARLSLTATAIAPVGLTYAVSAFVAEAHEIGFMILGAALLLVVICIFVFDAAKRRIEPFDFSVVSIEAADRENASLLLVYLLPLFTADFDSLNWIIWIPALLAIGLVVGTGYSYHFNPILGVMGWHFYKAATPEGVTYVLLTKKELRATSEKFKVGQLTEYIVVDLEK